jgi:hypothetical protein
LTVIGLTPKSETFENVRTRIEWGGPNAANLEEEDGGV